MADLILHATNGSVSIDINAGLGGLHKITLTAGEKSMVIDKQLLIDITAPALLAYIQGQSNAPVTPIS